MCLLLAFLLAHSACGEERKQDASKLRFWHTFNSNESSELEAWLAEPGQAKVATTILPFARATSRFRNALEDGQCPDLLRIDATRIPGLVESETIVEVPEPVWAAQTWLPDAAALVSFQDKHFGLPQTLDGLALVRRRGSTGEWPPSSYESWIAEARAAKTQPALGILLDGYWFVSFLRSGGAELPDAQGEPAANTEAAQAALTSFAELFKSGVAMDLLDERAPSRAMSRAFRRGQVQQLLTGPWELAELADGDMASLEVAAFPGGHAPRGGQVLVVPRCARDPEGGWALAKALTEPELQSRWAQRLSTIPVTRAGLDKAGPLVNEFYQALHRSRPLPRHSHVPELFDDLTPAVVAVVSGDASAAEALAGVSRAWDRLYGIERDPPLEP
jgi:ABC-type glycerol-3-phosphate transport system substrate-binding protein